MTNAHDTTPFRTFVRMIVEPFAANDPAVLAYVDQADEETLQVVLLEAIEIFVSTARGREHTKRVLASEVGAAIGNGLRAYLTRKIAEG